jgi:flagellar basal body-associated protein FliL
MDETEIITSKSKEKGKLIPALILAAVVIFFIILFAIVAFYWQKQSSETLEDSELTENQQRCVELGCPENSVYIGSINSDKYYECECHYADGINPENRICFFSDSEAEQNGRIKSEC